MGIIDIKRREIGSEGDDTVYDGQPLGYKWSTSATFIGRLRDSVNDILARNGRKFDNLYVTKKFSQRWHLFTSKGNPEIAFYFYYDSSGYNTYIYIGWNKLKTQAFIDMPQDEQAILLGDVSGPDPIAVWRKERSISTVGELLTSMPKQDADGAIGVLGSKMLNAIGKMPVSSRTIGRIRRLIAALDAVGTPTAIDLRGKVNNAFEKIAIVSMLIDIRDRNEYKAEITLSLLRKEGFQWSGLAAIERSIRSDKKSKNTINMQEDWWPFKRRHRISDAEARQYMDEWDDDPLGAIFSIWHAGDAVTDNPMLKKHVDDNKKEVIVTLLTRLRDASESYDDSAVSLLTRLRDIEVDWPELAVVEKSLNADKIKGINMRIEEIEFDELTMQGKKPRKGTRDRILYDIWEMGYYYRHMDSALRDIDHLRKKGYSEEKWPDFKNLTIELRKVLMKDLKELVNDANFHRLRELWPLRHVLNVNDQEWHSIMDSGKDRALKKLLSGLVGDQASYWKMVLQSALKSGLVWPEMKTLEKSLKAGTFDRTPDQQRLEAPGYIPGIHGPYR